MTALPHGPLFMDGTWLLLVSIKTTGDLQLLPTRCAMIQPTGWGECLPY